MWSLLLSAADWALTARALHVQVVMPMITPIRVSDRPSLKLALIRISTTNEGMTTKRFVSMLSISSTIPPLKPP